MQNIHSDYPLVSILVNNYNYGRYVEQAIDSALNQTYLNVEVVVVDDGSTDESRDVIQRYGEQVVKVFKQNGGQASAMNAGFFASRGDIICFLDADDVCLPYRAGEVVQHFKAFPEAGWFFHESVPIFSDGCIDIHSKSFSEKLTFRRQDHSKTDEIDFRQNIKKAELPAFAPSTSNICLSKSLAEKIFPLPEIRGSSGLAICDHYLKILSTGISKGVRTEKDLGVFRCHQENIYSTQEKDRKRATASEISIATAYCIRQYNDEFKLISNKLFAKGLGTHWRIISKDNQCHDIVNDYLSEMSTYDKLITMIGSFYYFLKLGFFDIV